MLAYTILHDLGFDVLMFGIVRLVGAWCWMSRLKSYIKPLIPPPPSLSHCLVPPLPIHAAYIASDVIISCTVSKNSLITDLDDAFRSFVRVRFAPAFAVEYFQWRFGL